MSRTDRCRPLGGCMLLCLATWAIPQATWAQQSFSYATGIGSTITNLQDSLAMTYFVPMDGIYPTRDEAGFSTYTMGHVRIQASPAMLRTESGTLANGRTNSTSNNAALYSLLGNHFGGGGELFRLPDLTGRLAVGTKPDGEWLLGEVRGSNYMSITQENLPTHVHTYVDSVGETQLLISQGDNLPIDNVQPSLGMRYMVAVNGMDPFTDNSLSGRITGQVGMFAADFEPSGWMVADGRLLRIEDYLPLFSVIGTMYGGDGQETFALPNLVGRTIVGAGRAADVHSLVVGEEVGADAITLTVRSMPPHVHAVEDSFGVLSVTSVAGGNPQQPIENRQPSIAMNYLIATEGLFPDFGSAPTADELYLGEVIALAGNVVPRGYLPADGRLLSIQQNAALFAILGNTYGGDGFQTFALPNLVGRAIIGAGESAVDSIVNPDAVASHSALLEEACPPLFPGDTPGSSELSLTHNQLPPHQHLVPEPSTFLAGTLGALLLAVRHRRCR